MLEYQIGQGYSALDAQAWRDKLDGYAVVNGLGVTVDSGLTVSVAAGTATTGTANGSVETVSNGSAATLALDAADSTFPRKDTIYLDATGTPQFETGVPESALPSGNSRFDTYQPEPPFPSASEYVILAEVFIDAGQSQLASGDIRDRRVPAEGIFGDVTTDAIDASGSITSHAGVAVDDDQSVTVGDDGDFGLSFNSTTSKFELVDADGTVLTSFAQDETLNALLESGGTFELDVTNLAGDLADEQDPKPHATEHENGGVDELNVGGLSGDLADAQDPKTHGGTHEQDASDEVLAENLGSNIADGNYLVGDASGGLVEDTPAGASVEASESDTLTDLTVYTAVGAGDQAQTFVDITGSGVCLGGWVAYDASDAWDLEITVDGATTQTYSALQIGGETYTTVPSIRFESSLTISATNDPLNSSDRGCYIWVKQ